MFYGKWEKSDLFIWYFEKGKIIGTEGRLVVVKDFWVAEDLVEKGSTIGGGVDRIVLYFDYFGVYIVLCIC